MPVVQWLIPIALFLPMFLGAKWRNRLQSRLAARCSRGRQIGIACLGYLGMIAFAAVLGLFGFYEHMGLQVPALVFLMSSANWLFGTLLLEAFRSAPKK